MINSYNHFVYVELTFVQSIKFTTPMVV